MVLYKHILAFHLFITRAKVIVSNEWLDFFIQVCMSSITPLLLLIMIYSVFDSNVRKFMFVMFKKSIGKIDSLKLEKKIVALIV